MTTTYSFEDIKPGCTLVVRASYKRNARRFVVEEAELNPSGRSAFVRGKEIRRDGLVRYRPGARELRHTFYVFLADIVEITEPNGA
jgi:hypothetical protein